MRSDLVSLAEDVLASCDDPLALELAQAVIDEADNDIQLAIEESFCE